MYDSMNNHYWYLDKIAPALKRLNVDNGIIGMCRAENVRAARTNYFRRARSRFLFISS
jgi:hypothetical protein